MELTVAGTGGKLGGGTAEAHRTNENATARTSLVFNAAALREFTYTW
jgi:hypothetical protein